MKDLRERAENLVDDILNSGQTKEQHIARAKRVLGEIRNEALEEAASVGLKYMDRCADNCEQALTEGKPYKVSYQTGVLLSMEIRKLMTSALAAANKED